MPGFVRRLFAVITIVGASTGVSLATAAELRLNNNLMSPQMLSAYAHAYIHSNHLCSPESDSRVRDEFVRMVLLGTHSEEESITKHTQLVAIETAYHKKQIEKLTALLKQYKTDHPIYTVYSKQFERLSSELVEIRANLKNEYDRKTGFERHENSTISNLENLSADEKRDLLRMHGFQKLYESNLQKSITDEAVVRRYEQLVNAIDDRLVNVFVLEIRSVGIVNKDAERVENVIRLVKQRVSGTELSAAAGFASAESLRDNRFWVNAKSFRSHVSTPFEYKVDDVYLDILSIPSFEKQGYRPYMLTYVFDTEHYPQIGLNQETLHGFSAHSYAKSVEYTAQLERLYTQLWSEANVTLDGSSLKMIKDYAQCQNTDR